MGARLGSVQTASGQHVRDAQSAGPEGDPLSPVCEAPTGFVVVAAHPLAGGIVTSYRQQFHAVVDPSDEAAGLMLRLRGEAGCQIGGRSKAVTQHGDSLLRSVLAGGRLVQEHDGSGAWWRCMCKTTQEFPATDGGVGAIVEALTLQEIVPEHVLCGAELRAALAPVDGGVAVLVTEGCAALVPEVFAAGAAAVLVFGGHTADGGSGESALAAAGTLERAIRLMRVGRRLDVAMRESGCDQHFALLFAPGAG